MGGKKCLAILLLLLTLPSGAQELETFVVTTLSLPQAQFAGYYMALERGFYREEGLDVVIEHPFASQSATDFILNGECQASLLTLSLAMRTVDDGFPLVNILQTSMNSATLIMSRWGEDPLTLRNAKVAAFRAGFGQLARSFSQMEDLDYEWVDTSTASAVNLFISGAVDATLARSYDEYYKILQSGLIDPEKGIYRFEDHEYNVQQEGVWMARKYYNTHREQAEAFARASRRGWEWTLEHPEEALEVVMRYVKDARVATNRTLQWLMLMEVLRLQKDHDSGVREFRLRPDMVEMARSMMQRSGMSEKGVSYEDLMP